MRRGTRWAYAPFIGAITRGGTDVSIKYIYTDVRTTPSNDEAYLVGKLLDERKLLGGAEVEDGA